MVLKRCKNQSYAPGSASKSTGLTAAPLQPSTMKRGLCSNTTTKEYLVAEYCEAAGLAKKPVTNELLDAAVRHMHQILLRDVCPPPGRTTNSPRLCQGKACCLVSRARAFCSGETIRMGGPVLCSEMS